MHSECGYFRQLPTGAVELILAQPTGIPHFLSKVAHVFIHEIYMEIGVASIEEGIFDGGELCVASKSIYRSSSAKHPFVTGFSRRFKVSPDGQTLNYEFFMSTENQTEELLHLVGSLTKSA